MQNLDRRCVAAATNMNFPLFAPNFYTYSYFQGRNGAKSAEITAQ